MKRMKIKRMGAMLLAGCLLTGMFSIMPGMSREVHAADRRAADYDEWFKTKFATKEQLMTSFGLDTGDTVVRIKFGENNHEWMIAGKDTDGSLAVLSTSDFGEKTFHASPSSALSNQKYSESDIVMETFPNILKDSTYFSKQEQDRMVPVTVTTEEAEGKWVSTTGKLYLPDAKSGRVEYITDEEIRVGSGTDIPIALSNVTMSNGFSGTVGKFWLRSPGGVGGVGVAIGRPGKPASLYDVGKPCYVVPACNLDVSSVLFASAVPAVSSEGIATVNNALTLRYDAGDELGKALMNVAQNQVKLEGVNADNTYLVAQAASWSGAWSATFWAKKVSGDGIVKANEMGDGFTSFADCKVWLESTDKGERITKATMAARGKEVVVLPGTGMQKAEDSGVLKQWCTNADQQMTAVKITAASGCYFPADYNADHSMDKNGICVTRDSANQITVSGIPTNDTSIQLADSTEKGAQNAPENLTGTPEKIAGTTTDMEYVLVGSAAGEKMKAVEDKDAAGWISCTDGETAVTGGTYLVRYKETETKKASPATEITVDTASYDVSVDATELDFGVTDEGYTASPDAHTVTITNNGNSGVTLTQPTAASYEIGALSATTLGAGETATFTVQPKADLGAGIYKETIPVATDKGTTAMVNLTFKVNGALSASISTDSAEILAGESLTLTVNAEGGSGDYSYQWYEGAQAEPIGDSQELTVSPMEATTYKAVVNDQIMSTEATATVTVIPRTYDIAVKQASLDFGTKNEGYTDTAAQAVILTNTGNSEVTLTQPIAENYEVGTLSATTLKAGESAVFTVQPKAGLAAGTYSETITMKSGQGSTAAVNVTFTVTVKEPDKPTPDKPTPDKPTPDKPTPDKPTPDKPTPDKPTPDKPSPDKPAPKEMHFSDVSEKDWYYQYVKYVFENGYMTGLNDTYFGAVKPVSRAQFATILYRIEGKPQVFYQNIFTDVPKGTFYSDAVMWAQSAGIMKGYENGKFGASDDITREQLVTTLYRYTQYKGKNTKTNGNLSNYPDVSRVSKFANDAMKWAVGESIIKGDGGKLNPQGEASRATTATIFQRYETNPEFK